MYHLIYAQSVSNSLPTGAWTAGNCPVWMNHNSFGLNLDNYYRIAEGYFLDVGGSFANSIYNEIYSHPDTIDVPSIMNANGDFILNVGTNTTEYKHLVSVTDVIEGGSVTNYHTKVGWKFRFRVKAGWAYDAQTGVTFVCTSFSTQKISVPSDQTTVTVISQGSGYTEYELRYYVESSTDIKGGDLTLQIRVNIPIKEVFNGVLIFNPCGGWLTDEFFWQIEDGKAYNTLNGKTSFPQPTWSGHTFLGWYSAKTGGVAVSPQTIASLSTQDASVTIYAHWREDANARIYTVFFHYNGGDGDISSKDVPVGSAIGDLPFPGKDWHSFGGWWSSSFGGTEYTSSSVMPDDDLHLYAQWLAFDCTVVFDAGGAYVSESNRAVPYGRQINKLPIAWRDGYKLLGWFTAPSGGEKVDKTYRVTGSITLYAQWVKAEIYDWWVVVPIS